jgi:hypothetical protein
MNKQDKLRRAAIVKLKYQMLTGNLDKGFSVVFQCVLDDLALKGDEVDAYLQEHLEELQKICTEEK